MDFFDVFSLTCNNSLIFGEWLISAGIIVLVLSLIKLIYKPAEFVYKSHKFKGVLVYILTTFILIGVPLCLRLNAIGAFDKNKICGYYVKTNFVYDNKTVYYAFSEEEAEKAMNDWLEEHQYCDTIWCEIDYYNFGGRNNIDSSTRQQYYMSDNVSKIIRDRRKQKEEEAKLYEKKLKRKKCAIQNKEPQPIVSNDYEIENELYIES